jgi:spermidine synthase
MTPWILLDSAQVPGKGSELRLYRRGDEFSIKIAGGSELMNSRVHGSEEALAEYTCARLTNRLNPRLLIGGLGMGFTLAAALRHVSDQAQVMVAELVPAVVAWNRGPLGDAAGCPLQDPRVTVREGDVARILMAGQHAFDAILLDVDNGPEGLTRKENDWLYSVDGLSAAYAALRPKGVLAVWSAGPDHVFLQRLRKVGFDTEEVRVRAHGSKGARHIIWFARRGV